MIKTLMYKEWCGSQEVTVKINDLPVSRAYVAKAKLCLKSCQIQEDTGAVPALVKVIT